MDSITRRFDRLPSDELDRPSAAGLTAWMRARSPALNPPSACLALAAAVLLSRHLRFDAADPHWPDRDRIVASPGLGPLMQAAADLAGAGPEFAAALPDPPGQSLGAGLGLAMAERILAARFGRSLVDHRTWVFAAPADLATGLGQEAAAAAAALRLGRLTVLAALPNAEPFPPGFAADWTVRRTDAGDEASLQAALSAALRSQKPTLIACIGCPPEPKEVAPAADGELLAAGALGGRGAGARRAWLRRLARHSAREEFDRTLTSRLPAGWHRFFSDPGPLLAPGQTCIAPTAANRQAFAKLSALLPELVCLPAEGSGTSLWQTNIQALACAAGGMTRHGGVIPVVHAPLCSVDSLGPALRTAAEAGLRVVHIVIEPENPCPTSGQRAGLRAMRNVFVFRPADASETLECAELALRRTHGPSVLFLSETACAPTAEKPSRTRCVHGGYVAAEPSGRRDATIIASGAELPAALRAQAQLSEAGVAAAVVSLPCWELFANQEPAWRDQILGSAPRIGVEAGSGFGWERWLGPTGVFVGSDAGPITCDKIAAAVLNAVGWTKSTKQPLRRRTS